MDISDIAPLLLLGLIVGLWVNSERRDGLVACDRCGHPRRLHFEMSFPSMERKPMKRGCERCECSGFIKTDTRV